jgi:type VI secretion system protein ImpE
MPEDARALLSQNRLDEAIAAQVDVVRTKPGDAEARALLAEFLCVAGQWERADKQLDLIGTQQPGLAVGVALFRQLIRGAMARDEVFTKGAVPEMLGGATEPLQSVLSALLDLRDGSEESASAALKAAEAKRVPLSGTCDGKPFDDIRDGCDLTAGLLEVISSTGKYFWVPLDRVSELELEKPKTLRERLWRQAALSVREGPDGIVYIPALYPALPNRPLTLEAKLGRVTDWAEIGGGAIVGVGVRTFLIGEHGVTLDEMTSLAVTPPPGGTAAPAA